MDKKINYFSVIFILVILYLSFLLIKPFLGALMSAVVISYILYPIYEKINKVVKNENMTIIFMVLAVILLILVPISFIAYSLVDDVKGMVNFFKDLDMNLIPFLTPEKIIIIKSYLLKASENLVPGLLSILSRLGRMVDSIFNILIFLFAMSLFLKDGPILIKKFKITIPIEDVQKNALIREFKNVTKNMIYSIILSAILLGISGGIIFYLFGIPNALLWGFVMGLLSFIPVVSNTPVWIGGMVYLILSGQYLMSGLLAVSGILLSQLESLLVMKMVGKKSKISSFLVLIGIISGVKVFGLLGIILGPLVLSILITLIKFYTKDYKEEFDITEK